MLERQREGRTGPPRPLQVKAPLLSSWGEAQLLFSFRACRAFQPVASALTLLPPGHPHPPSPPHLPVLAIPALEGTPVAPSLKCMYLMSIFGAPVARNTSPLLYGPYWHQPRQYEQVMSPGPATPTPSRVSLSINPSLPYLTPFLLLFEYLISVVSPLPLNIRTCF